MSDKSLRVGDAAPDFTLSDQEGKAVSLRELLASGCLVLYFYPKDDTPGCTTQACGIRDAWGELAKKAAVFGVSVDSVKKHRKFIDKYSLPFPLISDEDQSIVKAYGVWGEKSFMGRLFLGTERSTFVIDEEGRITAIFRKVKPAAHVDLLLEALG